MGKKISVHNPFDRSVVGEVEELTTEEVEQHLTAAQELFKDRGRWLPAHERVAILERLIQKMEASRDELADIAIKEGAKPRKDTEVEVGRAIQGVKSAIYELQNFGGKEIPMDLTARTAGRIAYTMKEPRGAVFALSAFNHPLNLCVHQLIPAFAVGAPCLMKPAETTPMSGFKLAEMLREAGAPPEYCPAFVCSHETTNKYVGDFRVKFVSFIGSARVGWELRKKLAPGSTIALEHGGVAPVILAEDADFDKAMHPLIRAGFYHAGQVCVSIQRIYVPKSRAKEFCDEYARRASELVVGDSMNADTDVGPLIRPSEVDRVEQWVKEAADGGAEILTGGNRKSDTLFEPTVLLDPPEDAKISTEEVFGPAVCVYTYDDFDDAVRRANALPYSFQASVFTQDINRALNAVRDIKALAVMVNDHPAFRADWMPFGGTEYSGYGYGGIPYAMDDMTHEKLMVINAG